MDLDEKSLNFYLNISILTISSYVIYHFLVHKRRDLNDLKSYDWKKFIVQSEGMAKPKKSDVKEKTKVRVKSFSKGNGFVKEENQFPVITQLTKKDREEAFLSFEEGKNLQDMINYAATMNNKEKEQMYPIESIYSQVMNGKEQITIANEKFDNKINEVINK